MTEEIRLAGEQAAAREREAATREREAAAKHRNSGSLFRAKVKQMSKEAQERRLRRDQQRASEQSPLIRFAILIVCTEAEREKLLEKLSLHDYIGALKRIRKKRHGTTSSWLTENKTFKDWVEDTNSSTLWLSGIRTILSTSFFI